MMPRPETNDVISPCCLQAGVGKDCEGRWLRDLLGALRRLGLSLSYPFGAMNPRKAPLADKFWLQGSSAVWFEGVSALKAGLLA